ncbi:unnamed protein product [Zymoseptoria tritici ST99CH_3D1]|uniref:Uncharacterized protein n=1 Tax=Zymoseptoria tritici ST99CH_1E4 TaxID=1276532 RepID=A0A2H1GPY9_ZYMTR|nr:unnamed protein product [Zymoseptoria tritici ST99CH_1E4]SMR58022.1 unnamed protein product [Zymoseptoria tritici ST99CH_3D1]
MPVFDLNVESMQRFYLACQAAIWYIVNEDGKYREAHRVADDAMSHDFGARMFWVMACENADGFVHHVQKYGPPTRDQSMEPCSTAILVKYVQRGGKKASSGDRARMIQTLAEQAREYLDVLILMRERGEEDINFRTVSGPELAQESRHPRPGERVLYQGPDIVFGKEEIQVSKGRLPRSELRRSIQRERDNVRPPKDDAEVEFSARRVIKIHEPRTDRGTESTRAIVGSPEVGKEGTGSTRAIGGDLRVGTGAATKYGGDPRRGKGSRKYFLEVTLDERPEFDGLGDGGWDDWQSMTKRARRMDIDFSVLFIPICSKRYSFCDIPVPAFYETKPANIKQQSSIQSIQSSKSPSLSYFAFTKQHNLNAAKQPQGLIAMCGRHSVLAAQ